MQFHERLLGLRRELDWLIGSLHGESNVGLAKNASICSDCSKMAQDVELIEGKPFASPKERAFFLGP